MVERAHKPGPLSPATSGSTSAGEVLVHSDRVKLTLTTGETTEILLYGATVISWKDSKGNEKLWLSEKAHLDGSKAVRGGIPIVFPVFGPPPAAPHPTSTLPQHGFARTSKWELLGKNEGSPASISVDFGLGPDNLTVDARKAWPFDFGLIYSVTLSANSLETKILVRNEGSESWDFQTLFHTYLRVGDISKVKVSGLKGAEFIDKVQKGDTTEENEEVDIAGEVDRVYKKVEGPVKVLEDGKTTFTVERTGLEDVVVWNPWIEKSSGMADFAPADGYKTMICIEAGAVREWNTLEPQSVWEGGVAMVI